MKQKGKLVINNCKMRGPGENMDHLGRCAVLLEVTKSDKDIGSTHISHQDTF